MILGKAIAYHKQKKPWEPYFFISKNSDKILGEKRNNGSGMR